MEHSSIDPKGGNPTDQQFGEGEGISFHTVFESRCQDRLIYILSPASYIEQGALRDNSHVWLAG